MAADPDEAAGAALVASMAGGAKVAPPPADADEAAGMALVKTIAAQAKPAAAQPQPDTNFTDSAPNEYGITGDPQQFNNLKPGLTIPTGDQARAAVESMPSGYFGIIPAVRSLALGALDVGQGRVAVRGGGVDEPPSNVFSLRPTEDTVNLLSLAAGRSPASGTGAAIRDTAELGAPVSRLYDPAPRTADGGNLLANVPRPTDLPPNRLAGTSGAPVTMPAAAIPDTTPGPKSVGAAASRDLSNPEAILMTPKEVAAYAATADGQKLIEPQPVGVPDNRQLVPGVKASTAEIEQTVNAARDAKTANIEHPAASQESKEVAAANNDERQRFVASVARSPVDVNNAIEVRSAQTESDLAATWKNKTEANAQPVIDAANEIKASPDGRRPIVRNAVDAVTSELFDADGKLITDPEQLYGVRKHIDDLLSKEAGATDPKSVRAAANLQQLKTALDGVIEPAAPGFNQYLKNFSDASKPIDEMQVLQGHLNKLYDTQGRMQLSRVQTMMRNIVDSRAAPGINPYKSISDDTMQKLWNLRDDLRRSASAQELARTPGSDTSQTMFDLAKQGIAAGGSLAAHGIAHAIAPVAGPIVLNALKAGIVNRSAASAQRAGLARALHNINPNRLVAPQD
jgi:hypothetical protein